MYLKVFSLYDFGQKKGPDGEEGEEEERENHLDVGPWPEAKHTQQQQLNYLQPETSQVDILKCSYQSVFYLIQ